jgi:hypothetical protein
MEMLGEAVGDAVPGDVRQRVAVQQQQRRPVATMAQMNAGAAGFDLGALEPFEHPRGLLPALSAG